MISLQQMLEAKVLIIDDEPANIMVLDETLKQEGYTNITTITDPGDALQSYKNFKPDLILLDLNMPHIDGFQVMKLIKEADPESNIPIMILTAQIDHGTRLRALDSGARDFLTKPFDILEVLLRIRNLLEISLLYNQLRNFNTSLDELYLQAKNDLNAAKSKLEEEIIRREELEMKLKL